MAKKNRTEKMYSRQANKLVLIVCEGEVTERAYFRAIRTKLDKRNITIIPGKGSNPKSILETAKNEYIDVKYDQIFCVFDKDTHPQYQSVITEIAQLSNRLRKPMPIKAVYSAPCFEYWLLLHFKYTAAPYNCTQQKTTGELCSSQLKKYMPDYDKSKSSIIKAFPTLYKKLDEAIKNAKKIQEASKNDGFDEPYTNMNELIEYLLDL